ncbi:MAG: hypothetical protein O7A65_00390 [Proteobacteria bacterium]|nr:hypothetical protein [Pseudomonadota bacterium]
MSLKAPAIFYRSRSPAARSSWCGKATAAFDNDIFSPAHEDAVRHFQGLVIDHVT